MLQLERASGANEGLANAMQFLADTLAESQISYDDFVLNLQSI
jgi:hypothetical protein